MASRLERLQDWELQSEDGELPPTFPIDYEAEILHTPMLEDVRSASQDWHLDAAQIENILASENAIGFEGFWLGRYETEQSSDASGDISRSPDRNRSIDVHEMFPLLDSTQRTDPPSCKDKMQEQKPKSDLVLYTPLWVRGEGAERAGWCGFCPSWHRLKDSTFVSGSKRDAILCVTNRTPSRTTICNSHMECLPMASK